MLSLYRKRLKSSKVFIYIVFDTQSKRVFKKNQEFAAQIDIMLFWAKFFAIKAPSNCSEMVNGHFNQLIK